MYRSVPLLHVVGCETHYTGKLQQEIVLKAEHGCGPDDGGFREDVSRDFFAATLTKTVSN